METTEQTNARIRKALAEKIVPLLKAKGVETVYDEQRGQIIVPATKEEKVYIQGRTKGYGRVVNQVEVSTALFSSRKFRNVAYPLDGQGNFNETKLVQRVLDAIEACKEAQEAYKASREREQKRQDTYQRMDQEFAAKGVNRYSFSDLERTGDVSLEPNVGLYTGKFRFYNLTVDDIKKIQADIENLQRHRAEQTQDPH